MSPTTSILDLSPGDFATVTALSQTAAQAPTLVLHGFVPGTRIQMVRRAPFGDPLIIRLRGVEVAMRAQDAEALSIERC